MTPHHTSTESRRLERGVRRRTLALIVALLGVLALAGAACSGGSGKSNSLTANTSSSNTGSFSDTGSSLPSFSDTSGFSDTGGFSDSSDYSSMLTDFSDTSNAADPSHLRDVFLNSCESSGGSTTLCECVANKLDFSNPSSLISGAQTAARECVQSGQN